VLLRHSTTFRLSASRVVTLALVTTISSVACDRPSAGQSVSPPPARQSAGSTLPAHNALSDALKEKRNLTIAGSALDAALLRRVYEPRGYKPIWTESSSSENEAKRVLDQLRHAADDGLDPENYRADQLAAALSKNENEKTDFELLMTDSVLRYAHDVRMGRVKPSDVDEDVSLPSVGFDFARALSEAAMNGKLSQFLPSLAPTQPDYARLKTALARYRLIQEAGAWPVVPGATKVSGPNAQLLRARLQAEDEAVSRDGNSLIVAVQRFQKRNGLKADGIIGPKTLAALNVSAANRIAQISANMERWRWLPRAFEARYIAVNAADATLKFADKGETVLESKIVAGQPDWRTPILRTQAVAVTVNPVWHIPASIAKKEYLPKLQMNPNTLQSEGLVLVGGPADDPYGQKIDWASKTEFPYSLQQPAGPKNALGTLKIEMPNKFDVYLHDTPMKQAFAEDSRTLSHGCMRVQQIAPLVSLALNGDAQSGLSELSQMIAAGETKKLTIDRPIPVYVLYWTAFVDSDGAVEFRPDVYERDSALLAALKGEHVSRKAVAELGI